jgi:hypothetical protein
MPARGSSGEAVVRVEQMSPVFGNASTSTTYGKGRRGCRLARRRGLNTGIFVYGKDVRCTTLTLGGLQEESEYEEYASYKHAESGKEEHHLESGVLYQSLGGEASGEREAHPGSVMPLCEAVAEGPCARLVPCGHCKGAPESECNKTGQHCSGHRGGGHHSQRSGGCLGEEIVSFVGGSIISIIAPETIPYVIGVGGVVNLKCDS